MSKNILGHEGFGTPWEPIFVITAKLTDGSRVWFKVVERSLCHWWNTHWTEYRDV
jgi:hypothetical protein